MGRNVWTRPESPIPLRSETTLDEQKSFRSRPTFPRPTVKPSKGRLRGKGSLVEPLLQPEEKVRLGGATRTRGARTRPPEHAPAPSPGPFLPLGHGRARERAAGPWSRGTPARSRRSSRPFSPGAPGPTRLEAPPLPVLSLV